MLVTLKNQICFVGICCKLHRDVIWENVMWERCTRIYYKIGEDNQFLDLGLKRRWMYIEKDCGHKHYALFNEPLRDMTKEGWYLSKKTEEVDNWMSNPFACEKIVMCVVTYDNLSFWQSCHWSIKMHVVGEWCL